LGYTVFADHPPTPAGGTLEAALGLVIRNSPSWVARAVGRAAYRYAA
jgi:hypothetical protein